MLSEFKMSESNQHIYIYIYIYVQTLHSIVSSQLAVPQSRLKGFGDPAFSIAAPSLWNALPGSITDCKSIGALKKSLIRHLFKFAFE